MGTRRAAANPANAHSAQRPPFKFTPKEYTLHTTNWRDDYELIVADLVTKGVTTLTDLCGITGLLRDEVSEFTDQLCRRGLIKRDPRRRDAFTA